MSVESGEQTVQSAVWCPGRREICQEPFVLPEKYRYASAAVSYLQSRGIDADIINRCMENGTLYESKRYHDCVFVGKDRAGKARYAYQRGTEGGFKKEVAGGDKRYGFCILSANPESPYLAVAKTPIDLLSVASLVKRHKGEWERAHYLSLGGPFSYALLQFLHDHPKVSCISLCLDADRTGTFGMEAIHKIIEGNRKLDAQVTVLVDNPPPAASGCKDYNQLLVEREKLFKEMRK